MPSDLHAPQPRQGDEGAGLQFRSDLDGWWGGTFDVFLCQRPDPHEVQPEPHQRILRRDAGRDLLAVTHGSELRDPD